MKIKATTTVDVDPRDAAKALEDLFTRLYLHPEEYVQDGWWCQDDRNDKTERLRPVTPEEVDRLKALAQFKAALAVLL